MGEEEQAGLKLNPSWVWVCDQMRMSRLAFPLVGGVEI